MNSNLSLARTDDNVDRPKNMILSRCTPLSEDSADHLGKFLDLVGEGKRVLVLGPTTPALLRGLEEHGADLVTEPFATSADGNNASPSGTGDGFDVVVAVNALENALDPLAVLNAARGQLRSDGYIVVRVANVAHGSVRLAMLAGQFPHAAEAASQQPLRYFTYTTLMKLFELAGYAVGAVEREEEEIVPPSSTTSGCVVDVLDAIAAEPDARTSQFLVVGLPLPSARLGWVHSRMQSLVEDLAASRREADELRQDRDAVDRHVRMLVEQQESALRRERELRAKVLAGHDLLMTRDEEYQAAIADYRAQSEDYRAATETYWLPKEKWWQDKLAEWDNTEKWWLDKERQWHADQKLWLDKQLHWEAERAWWQDKLAEWENTEKWWLDKERQWHADQKLWLDKQHHWEAERAWWQDKLAEWENTEKWWLDKERQWHAERESAAAREAQLRSQLAECMAQQEQMNQEVLQLSAQVSALEARWNRVRSSLPGRVFRAIRRLFGRG